MLVVAALVSGLLASSLATARPDNHEHSGHAAQHNEVDTGEEVLWRMGGEGDCSCFIEKFSLTGGIF